MAALAALGLAAFTVAWLSPARVAAMCGMMVRPLPRSGPPVERGALPNRETVVVMLREGTRCSRSRTTTWGPPRTSR